MPWNDEAPVTAQRFDTSRASYALDAVGRGIRWFVDNVVLGFQRIGESPEVEAEVKTCHLCDEQGTYYTPSGKKECECPT